MEIKTKTDSVYEEIYQILNCQLTVCPRLHLCFYPQIGHREGGMWRKSELEFICDILVLQQQINKQNLINQ